MRRRAAPQPGDPGLLIAILVPVLGRPRRAAPLVRSVRETSNARVVFLVNHDDAAQERASRRAGRGDDRVETLIVPWDGGTLGDYARKINYGVRHTEEPWLFQAGDDLRFHQGWQETCLAVATRTGASVIGTNDLCNPRVMRGGHSTHSLVARAYIEERGTVDEPGKMLHEGYRHNFVDDELIQTARRRRAYAFARDASVEHLHPICGKNHDDATYRRGHAGFDLDRRLLLRRRRAWR